MKRTLRTYAPGALALIAALALSGCAQPAPSTAPLTSTAESNTAESSTAESSTADCSGVSVVVDFGTLKADPLTECVDADGALAASAVMQTAGISTEGTVEYGDQIVCRVNDRPAADETVEVAGEASFTESCASMPAAYAYWALWVKSTPDADWAYAQEGLGSLQTAPGETLGLVYTTGTETPTPGS
ncbi:hypothetical protein E3T55_04805 [Cryobacterium frigoriphilum]|uniref:Uncharacterized protein n=1 Tax=Cryobacterium frigoriphilum TaxID=1259150 RepID=A0A4R9A804_9MICO|nr:hypothetical protein [Cryobacterium frigoriphilum]TFD54009.1 hypothetical protein E3T55_04805 [Cryobacterium frigoriphilum]